MTDSLLRRSDYAQILGGEGVASSSRQEPSDCAKDGTAVPAAPSPPEPHPARMTRPLTQDEHRRSAETAMRLAGHTTRYRTIVADPPWAYDEGWPIGPEGQAAAKRAGRVARKRTDMAYPSMTVEEIAALPVGAWAAQDAHLYLWTTNRYLWDAKSVAEAWGFRFAQLLVWAKTPMGIGPGGTWAQSTEYVLFCRRGSLKSLQRFDSTWFNWKRMGKAHSRKPDAFLDMVEQASPGPRLEMFARRARFGWDYYGDESLGTAEVAA